MNPLKKSNQTELERQTEIMIQIKNFFEELPLNRDSEFFEDILEHKGFKLERIISFGQNTPENEWFDQDQDEWVILLKGSASLVFEDKPGEIELKPGDHLLIKAHQKHRVSYTDPEQPSFWAAIHFDAV